MAMKLQIGAANSKNNYPQTYDDSEGEEIIAEINVTPLVDIFLLLLVIFMVTSSAISPMNIPVQLPQSTKAAHATRDPGGIIVTVNASEEFFINGVKIDGDRLGPALELALGKTADKTIVVEGDRRAILGSIVRVMDEGKKAGALRFSFATSEK